MKPIDVYCRKAIWISQENPRKKKIVKSLMDWKVLDMSHRMSVILFNIDPSQFDKAPSEQYDFWAWLDEGQVK